MSRKSDIMRNREREEDEGLRKGRKGSKAIYWFEKCRQKTDHNCSVYGSEERGYCSFKKKWVKTSKNQSETEPGIEASALEGNTVL